MADLLTEAIQLVVVGTVASALYVQGQAFFNSAIKGTGVESALVGLTSFLAFLSTRNVDFLYLALLTVSVRSIVTPWILLNVLGLRGWEREKTGGVASTLLINLSTFFTSSLIVVYVALKGIGLLGGERGFLLIFPFILLFQGLFLIASRRSTIAQILGYIEEENALILLGLFLVPVPLLIEASVLLDVLALVVISSLVILEKREHEVLEELVG